MKYLYPYECEKRGLSSPGELQAAIDSNRREGRRQTFGTTLFNYSPVGTPAVLSSPKIPLPALSISTHSCGQLGQVHSIKKGEGPGRPAGGQQNGQRRSAPKWTAAGVRASERVALRGRQSSPGPPPDARLLPAEDSLLPATVPGRLAIPVSLAGHHLVAAQAAASQAAALEQLREKLETGEPPEKKVALMAEEQQRLVQHALQQNLLAVASQLPVSIKLSNRGGKCRRAAEAARGGSRRPGPA